MIKHLTNEIIDLKKNKGEGKKPLKPFIKKRTNIDTPPQIPPILRISLDNYAMDNLCHTHHANHSEKTCSEFINSFSKMFLPPKPPKKDKKNEEEEEVEEGEQEHPSNLNLIWDDTKMDDIDDDVMEEDCVGNDYNLQSKGVPMSNNSPTSKKATNKTPTTTTSTPKDTSIKKYLDTTKTNEKDSNKSTTNMDISQKILSDLKLN